MLFARSLYPSRPGVCGVVGVEEEFVRFIASMSPMIESKERLGCAVRCVVPVVSDLRAIRACCRDVRREALL